MAAPARSRLWCRGMATPAGTSMAGRRPAALLAAALVTGGMLLGGGTASAAGAVINVATTGSDTPTCGAAGTPCLTIPYAFNVRATPGDTIVVAPGTYDANAT